MKYLFFALFTFGAVFIELEGVVTEVSAAIAGTAAINSLYKEVNKTLLERINSTPRSSQDGLRPLSGERIALAPG